MSSRAQEFVAEDLWLLIAIVTFVLAGLAAVTGTGALITVIPILGWFLLTPIFLFWGEDIAAVLFDENESGAETQEDDALGELKRRYAEGEIDDDEFEHRVDRLLEVDFSHGDTPSPDSRRVDGVSHSRSDTDPAVRDESVTATVDEEDADGWERER